MATWEEFEVQCTNYLNSRFGHYAKFFHQGGADSTVLDILVKTNSGKSFYIDAKHSPAQCGQFVLLPNLGNHTFEYSPKNINIINGYAEMIMNYMNQDFDAFREAGVSGKDIYMKNGSDIFANWIIQTYKNKGVRFFITNQYMLFPIERFSDYFEVTAKYRIKRSGSGNVGKSRINSVTDYMRPFQVLCKLKKPSVRFVDSYKWAEPDFLVLPISVLYRDFSDCQYCLKNPFTDFLWKGVPQNKSQAGSVSVPSPAGGRSISS